MAAATPEDLEMLGDAARAWVRERAPVSLLRRVREQHGDLGYDPEIYAEMAAMGWAGMLVPVAYGGHDFGFQGMGRLVEELGRTLTPSPLIASAVGAVSALLLVGSEAQKQQWLPRLASGASVGVLALDEGPHQRAEDLALTASRSGDGWRLNGLKRPVEAGMGADLLIVAARSDGAPGEARGLSLFLCDPAAPGVERHALSQIDSRAAAVVRFDQVALGPGQLLGEADAAQGVLEQILDRARAVVAAEMLGSMQEAFDRTTDYLKTRKQFGRLIGSFQALQHRAVGLAAEIELARSAVYGALAALDAGAEDIPLRVSVAKAVAGRTFNHVAREMIQMHGGIGMTEEHDAGLYLKRAHTADIFGGNVAYHRDRFGKMIGV